MNRFLCALLLALCSIFASPLPQDTPPSQTSRKKSTPASDIFSGTVSDLNAEAVTVIRKVAGQSDESRRFVLDSQTRVEGRLRLNVRVTVRYQAGDEGELRALHIIVR